MTTLKEIFMGTPQSNYAALAIVCAIIAVCLSIIFNNSALDFGERLSMIAFVVLFSIPSILLSLFELTCISNDTVNYPYCGWYGWVITALIVIYSVIVIVSSLMSMLTYNNATAKADADDEQKKVSKESANEIARNMMGSKQPVSKPADPIAPAVPAVPQQAAGAPDGYMASDSYASAFANPNEPSYPAVEQPKGSQQPVVEPYENSFDSMYQMMGSMMNSMPFDRFDKKRDGATVEGFVGGEYATLE